MRLRLLTKVVPTRTTFFYNGKMLKSNLTQQEIEMVTLDSLVPKDHLVRKLDKAIDLNFIRNRVAHLYCPDNGRPALDPVVFFKLLLLGYLFGIRSERQLMRDVEVNVAYRWYIGYSLTQKVPDASTLSQTRRRRFSDNNIYQDIFEEIVRLAMQHKMVDGDIIYTDSTHLKANANKNKFTNQVAYESTQSYLKELDQAISIERQRHGQKPLQPRQADKQDDDEPPAGKTRNIKVSTTDPDCGYMHRDGKPKGFFYLDHRSVDSKFAIITDTYVTAGNVHDSRPYLERLDHQIQRFGFTPHSVGLDASYVTSAICHGLEQRGIAGVMGYRRPNHKKGYFYKREYLYDKDTENYICPQGQRLIYKTTDRQGYKHYHSNAKECIKCPVREKCTQSKNITKVLTRHVWEDSKEEMNARRLSPQGKKIYARRKETVERSFADAKQLHGHRYARFRGLTRVMQQCLLAATAQNMKKIALHLWKMLICLLFSPPIDFKPI